MFDEMPVFGVAGSILFKVLFGKLFVNSNEERFWFGDEQEVEAILTLPELTPTSFPFTRETVVELACVVLAPVPVSIQLLATGDVLLVAATECVTKSVIPSVSVELFLSCCKE